MNRDRLSQPNQAEMELTSKISHLRNFLSPANEASSFNTRQCCYCQHYRNKKLLIKQCPKRPQIASSSSNQLLEWFMRRQFKNRLRYKLLDQKFSTSYHYYYYYHHHHRYKTLNSLSSSALIMIIIVFSFILIATQIVRPVNCSSEYPNNNIISTINKNSAHFTISQLCAGKSLFSVTKRVEGAVLTSNGDVDVNCTITFRTKSSQQLFVIRFEELKLGCEDHLKMFDGDLDYGQPSIKDFSCRDSLANVPTMKTTGSFLTIRFSSDSKAFPGDGFRLVVTAIFDHPSWDCPVEYALCSNRLCISRSLFCDDVNHCVDNSDEVNCNYKPGSGLPGSSSGSSIFTGELSLSNTLGLLVVLVLVIFTCVIIFISAIYCRRESHYAQYQHHLQRAIGVPIQNSSSLMFTNQPQYHYFQPANLSPYITPQHHQQQQHQHHHFTALTAGTGAGLSTTTTTTLPRGYSTLPLNLAPRQSALQQPPTAQQILTSKGSALTNSGHHNEYLMMAGMSGPPGGQTTIHAAPTLQTNLFTLPSSQSILATGIHVSPSNQQQQQQQQQETTTRR